MVASSKGSIVKIPFLFENFHHFGKKQFSSVSFVPGTHI
jgi:hypothetical protein